MFYFQTNLSKITDFLKKLYNNFIYYSNSFICVALLIKMHTPPKNH